MSDWLKEIASIPWRSAASTLRERFREDRLGLTAGSLTFTTTIALVPLITVALAVFTAFPMFAKFQDVLQKWLIESLVPDNIARQVLGYLNQFAGKASRLGVAGLTVLLGTALALVFTIDRTLNNIWRVRKRRPFAQRVLIYWAAVTLGPLLLGASLSITSYAVTTSRSLVGGLPGGLNFLLNTLQFALVAAGTAATFFFVPNTPVRWGHAWMGGLFVSAGMELARKVLALYLGMVPTYSAVYGAFATVPILLVWIYTVWVIVLLGAALTAYLPSLTDGVPRRKLGPGWQFQLGLEVLQMLDQARCSETRGLSLSHLRRALRVDPQRLEPVLEALVELDWVGQLDEIQPQDNEPRYVVLTDLDTTELEPWMQRMLLAPEEVTSNLWKIGRWRTTTLREALQKE
jgi:membrane protein